MAAIRINILQAHKRHISRVLTTLNINVMIYISKGSVLDNVALIVGFLHVITSMHSSYIKDLG